MQSQGNAGAGGFDTMVPTVFVGIGGTGHEVLARIRRLIEETYGSLDNFPIVGFLIIDTDKDYKVSSPEAAGTTFKEYEKLWASVSSGQVSDIMANMGNYPWIESWFPSELERNIGALEAGAGQIRACGRFALFYNYHKVQQAFMAACDRLRGHENFMLDRHNIRMVSNRVNVFITGSLSGGTGSGMLLDLGYGIRHWLRGAGGAEVTAIMPMPTAFANISVGDRVLANGYAAMMELSYFSDYRTEYGAQYSSSTMDEIRDRRPPFDFTYLVGTKNGSIEFTLEEIREMIAQNIFLDLTSSFAPHKRSIRDNIKGSWAQADPGGRGFPKNFMGFGLSTVEIPVAQIRASLSARLAADVVGWWRNPNIPLPADMYKMVHDNLLGGMHLTGNEILKDLTAASDRPFQTVISDWVTEIRQDIVKGDRLSCTQQGLNLVGKETGNILTFVTDYLKPKVDDYYRNNFSDLGQDERTHGAILRKMYGNREQLVQQGRAALEGELYRIIEDRNRGPRFAREFLDQVDLIFTATAEQFRKDLENLWLKNIESSRDKYNKALEDLNFNKAQFNLSKQAKMEEYCDEALSALQGWFIAELNAKGRDQALKGILAPMQEHLQKLKQRFDRFNKRLQEYQAVFQEEENKQANSADSLIINGIKIYDRQEINDLYDDFLEQLASGNGGSGSLRAIGLDILCGGISAQVLQQTSRLWEEGRNANQTMRLFDLTKIDEVLTNDVRQIIAQATRAEIKKAPGSSKLVKQLDACTRIFQFFDNNEANIRNQLGVAYQKSHPFILLSQAVMTAKDAGFTPQRNAIAALVGGANTSEPAAQKLLPYLEARVGQNGAIKPLGLPEKHRVVFVQEIGGFSLRCVEGMRELRQSYQDWKGQAIQAKRAKLRGESQDLPIPVHIQKEPPFWDIFPEDSSIFSLVIQARALGVLRLEQNQHTKEHNVCYTVDTVTGKENVDIAGSWEEAVQVLEVKACRQDKETISQQVQARLDQVEDNPQEKTALYQRLIQYLRERAIALQNDGGTASPDYRRENTIIQGLILTHKLNEGAPPMSPGPEPTTATPAATPVKITAFCTNCGTETPPNAKFCHKCGTPLTPQP